MLKDLLGDQPDESINPIDDHSGLSGDGAGGGGLNQYPDNDPVPVEVGRGEINRDLEHNIGNLSEAEQEQIKRQLQQVCKRSSDTTSGSLAAGIEQQLVIKKVRPSRKWERVIKKWAKTKMKQTEQWVQVDRRWMYTDATIMVPSTHEQEDRGRIDVMFYMDASISCADEVARFLKAARSLPKDRFRVLLRSFDTTVYELDINEDKAEGFGGTAFAPLEAHALEQRKYPDAVFVLTDGIGDEITPMYPKRWHWFLTESGYEGLIDKRCNIHHLASYG
jgi:predicted metal-dependent peptidase